LEKLPRKLENSGKTESAFFNGNGWNNVAIFFNVRNNPNEVFIQAVPKKEDESITPLFIGRI
jgi:hypothetical protein